MKRRDLSFLFLIALPVLLTLTGCANPGSGPDGGPYDERPPQVLNMMPQLGVTNAAPKRITLRFDEYINIANAQEKVIVSPPQVEEPEIKVNGKKINIELHDALKDSTTYTIDFSDAIEDYNEGNPMGNFTYYFSTGDRLDTMEVAGCVLQADNLSPMQGILVGLHRNLSDTAFRKLPFDRVGRTDANGRFCIKGVAQGTYRIYALNDQDKDFRFSLRGEEIAFDTMLIRPSAFADVRYDTLWKDTLHYTKITPVPFTHFTPDNLTLLAFREEGQMRALLKTLRAEPESFTVFFTAPSDSTPKLKGLNFDERQLICVRSKGNDTLTYWVADSTLLKQDTLRFEIEYLAHNDSTQLIETRREPLDLVPRLTYARRAEMKAEAYKKWLKQHERRVKRGISNAADTPPRDYLRFDGFKSRFSPLGNFTFTASEPVASIDTAGISLSLKVNDSTYVPARFRLIRDTLNVLQHTIRAEWRPGQDYVLKIDSAAFMSIYGNPNEGVDTRIQIGKADTYGTLFVKLPGASADMVVQMLYDDKKVYRQEKAKKGIAEFYYLNPGKYYLRAFDDRNGDGVWTPGNFDEGRTAEAVFYFNGEIEVRPNWDIDQTWDVHALPLTKQKPEKLLKKKDRKKSSAAERNRERLREKGLLKDEEE